MKTNWTCRMALCELHALCGESVGAWWSRGDSNPRPPRCHRGALPTAPRPHRVATFEYYHRKIARVYKIAAGISASLCRGTNLKIVAFARMVTSEAARVAL